MNEQMKKLEAIKNRCHTASKVLGIIRGFVIFLTVIVLLAGILIFAKANVLNPELIWASEEGYFDLHSTIDYNGPFNFMVDLSDRFGPENPAAPLWITCMIAGFTCLVVAVILTFIKKIFTSLETENTPFSEKCMKQIKVSFIVIGITSLMSMSLGVTIIVGLILYCIYSIFEYGAALQTEIDETL
ncbi:MAG: hypothetical protein J6W85_05365 [Lachnospiraceae bacterium]|nr:hypothetical protein [Lachnospiraceae bacterium]